MDSNPQTSADQHEKVCIVGSGNWGSAIATMVGRNCERLPHCETDVNMWVYEEEVETEDGSIQKLTDVINTQHENIKYLPGIRLPDNIKAVPDLAEACEGATLLIFVLPHQFLPKLLPTIREAAHPSCRGVSLIKGLGTLNTHAPFLQKAAFSRFSRIGMFRMPSTAKCTDSYVEHARLMVILLFINIFSHRN